MLTKMPLETAMLELAYKNKGLRRYLNRKEIITTPISFGESEFGLHSK